MTYFTHSPSPVPNILIDHVRPAQLQKPLDRAYRAAGLTAPTLVDQTMDEAIVATRAELEASIASLLADGQKDPNKAVKAAATAQSQIVALDALAAQRNATSGRRTVAAFGQARAQAYAVDLAPAAEETVQTIIDTVAILEGVRDPLDAEQVIRSGRPAQAWTDLIGALGRLADLACLEDTAGLFRWIDVPTPEGPTVFDSTGLILPDDIQDPVNAAVLRFRRAGEHDENQRTGRKDWGGLTHTGEARDVDHRIIALAAGDFAPLKLSYTADPAEVQRRKQAWTDSLAGRKLSSNEYASRTHKPQKPKDAPFTIAPRNPADVAFQRGQ